MDVGVFCVLPDTKFLGHATSQLVADLGAYCSMLGFKIVRLQKYWPMPLKLLFSHERVGLILYPGLLNPIITSPQELFIKGALSIIYILTNMAMTRLLNKKTILYIYDLPIEQNLHSYGKLNYERLSRVIERLFLKSSSVIMVFNELMARWLSRLHELNKNKFVTFDILDYGFNIEPPKAIERSFSNKIRVIYPANFTNPRVRSCIERFISSCDDAKLEFVLVGKGSELAWHSIRSTNVKLLGEVSQATLSRLYGYCHFGLVLKCSQYYEFGATSKFSSYLHSGLPVLVPRNYRYLSQIVEKFNVGIVFEDCQDLSEKLKALTPQAYQALSSNAMKLGDKVRRGFFFKRALLKALKLLR